MLMCVIPELYRVEISYFCQKFFVAVALILLSCTFSESANLPVFIVELSTWCDLELPPSKNSILSFP
jgi:hypothetical protein